MWYKCLYNVLFRESKDVMQEIMGWMQERDDEHLGWGAMFKTRQ